jgi:uridylate kinase
MKYSRILLKLSGEALMGAGSYGIDTETVKDVAAQIWDVRELGTEIGIVVGGGNIYRGLKAEKQGMDRVTADYMGMLATVMNALTLQDALRKLDLPVRVQTAIDMDKVAEPYISRKAIEYLESGAVVIFACGTGNPYFTTDTAAALRALEIKADVIFKATKVNGVFDKDPVLFSDALFFSEISYMDVLQRELKVMDATAISLCMENDLPVVVFNLKERDNMRRAVLGEQVGTTVRRLA